MGDDSFDDEGYQKSIDQVGIPAQYIPGLGSMAGANLGAIQRCDPDKEFKKPSLLQSLKKMKEEHTRRIENLGSAISILEKNPDIEKFLDVYNKIR